MIKVLNTYDVGCIAGGCDYLCTCSEDSVVKYKESLSDDSYNNVYRKCWSICRKHREKKYKTGIEYVGKEESRGECCYSSPLESKEC